MPVIQHGTATWKTDVATGSAMQSFAFYIIHSLALPPTAELLVFLWLYLQRTEQKKYQGTYF